MTRRARTASADRVGRAANAASQIAMVRRTFAQPCTPSLLPRSGAAQRLDAAAALLALQAADLRGEGRLGRPPPHRPHGGGADEFDETRQRVLAVALLGAMALGRNHHHAV